MLVPEVNLGQLSRLLRAEYLVDVVSFTQLRGIPFRAAAMEAAILELLNADGVGSVPGDPTVGAATPDQPANGKVDH